MPEMNRTEIVCLLVKKQDSLFLEEFVPNQGMFLSLPPMIKKAWEVFEYWLFRMLSCAV